MQIKIRMIWQFCFLPENGCRNGKLLHADVEAAYCKSPEIDTLLVGDLAKYIDALTLTRRNAMNPCPDLLLLRFHLQRVEVCIESTTICRIEVHRVLIW